MEEGPYDVPQRLFLLRHLSDLSLPVPTLHVLRDTFPRELKKDRTSEVFVFFGYGSDTLVSHSLTSQYNLDPEGSRHDLHKHRDRRLTSLPDPYSGRPGGVDPSFQSVHRPRRRTLLSKRRGSETTVRLLG